MAENVNALILPIGADPSQFKKSIQDVKDRIKELSEYINNRSFNFVTPENKLELNELKRTLRTLQDDVQNTSNAFDKSQSSTKGARTALTSLTLVAQDLPFGFIAIQNNLPALIQSFGELQRTSGGVKGALSQIGSAITGPGGLFLAFSVVTAGVTFLVQKYGTLGNAIDALIGKSISLKSIQDKLNKSFDDTVKSTAGEIANLNSLVGVLTNANSKKEQQLGAYDELNKKYPGFLFNIDRENIATATSAKLIAERTKLISQQIILEGRRNALIELIGQSAKEGEIALRGIVTQGKDLAFFEKVLLGIRGTFAGVGGAGVLNILSSDLGNAAKESQFFKDQLDGVNNVLTETNNAVNILIKSQEELEKKQKDAASAAEKAAKDAERQALKASIGTITQGEAVNNGIITSDIGLLTRVIEANVRLTNLAVDRMRRYRDRNTPGPLDLMPDKLNKKTAVPMSAELEQEVGATLLELDRLATKFNQTNQALQTAFFQPLTSAFEQFFETGKIGFKEFGKSIIKTIQQIVSRIIATGIINLLASILVPGGTQAASLVGGAAGAANSTGIGRAFGDAFRSVLGLGGNRVAAPSFAGIGGGGMQMNGQVVFVQRGSDLVGVLNRTNGTINRVG